MYPYTDYDIHGAIPLLFISPCWFPFAPLSSPLYLLGTLLAVTGSVHLGLRLLVDWPPLSQPFPDPSPLQIPSTQFTKRLTMTTSRIRLLLSGTICTCILESLKMTAEVKFINISCRNPDTHIIISFNIMYCKHMYTTYIYIYIYMCIYIYTYI